MQDSPDHSSSLNLPANAAPALTYARARLWLGMTAVSAWVTVAVNLLVARVPQNFLPNNVETFSNEFRLIAMLLGAYVLISLPFDFLGGYWLPLRHKRSTIRMRRFAANWARGAFFQYVILMGCALGLLQIGRWGGAAGVLALVACLTLLLLALQFTLARCVGRWLRHGRMKPSDELNREMEKFALDAKQVRVVACRDEGFTGGIVGIPGQEQIVLPTAWQSEMTPAQLALIVARRMGMVRTGSRRRGIVVAALWNLAGLAVIFYVAGVQLNSVADLVTVSLGMTVWSFIGLLTLPSISRPAVLLADRIAAAQGADRELLEQTIRQLDRKLDDEPARDPFIETIFHPVPCVNERLAELESSAPIPWNAWHSARMALYLSWACLGLLSRAVHCNAGRPELWVLLPCD